MSDYVWPGNSNTNKMWWDLENNPVPGDLKLEYVYERLKYSLALKGLEGSLEVKAFVANSKYWKPIPGEEIVDLGLPEKKKNASDNAILKDMIKFLNKKHEPTTNILMSSGNVIVNVIGFVCFLLGVSIAGAVPM